MPRNRNALDEASRYLASTLHEIRTPIQTIIGTIELLQETQMDKEQHEYIRQIQFSANVLLDLANNILDFSKIRSNEFKLESVPFNIIELTEQVVDLISIEAFNRGLEIITDIDFSIPSIVTGDPVRVQQIILNLLKNAVKFTNHGYIHVELKRDDNKVYFKVTDTGIGITDDQKAKLFTNYYQGDISTYRRFGGTGLGLSISKNLVTAMKGSIGVESNPEGGSIFWFKLPLIDVNNSFNFESSNIPSIPHNQKILIVDDNLMAASSLISILNYAGISQIISTDSPERGIQLLTEAQSSDNPFTLVFVDMIMNGMDGWHFASEVKNSGKIKKEPAMYLLVPEGQMQSEAKMKMLDWFKGYLYKPFKHNIVMGLLKETLTSEYAHLEELEAVTDNKTGLSADSEQNVAKGKKILIAEDHPVNRKLLETFIKKYGAEVFLAENGQEAIEQIEQHPEIDLIFMDIQMPVKNGIEATIQIRKDGYNGIIIACTANNDENDFTSYRKVGINDIIVKPFKSSSIKTMLENWATIMELPVVKNIATLESDSVNKGSAWDKEDFLDTTQGNTDLAITIIAAYIDQTDELLKTADEIIENKDFEALRQLGHSLSGSSATVSAKKLAEYGKRLNISAKNMDIPASIFNLAEFRHEYTQFKKLTQKFLDENKHE